MSDIQLLNKIKNYDKDWCKQLYKNVIKILLIKYLDFLNKIYYNIIVK